MKEVLSNSFHAILMNEYKRESRVEIEVNITDDTKIELRITDTGCGISDSERKYFEILDEKNPLKYEKKLASKGQGRLALCYFLDRAKYTTRYRMNNNQLFEISFEYPQPTDALFMIPDQEILKKEGSPGTTLTGYITTPRKFKKAQAFFQDDWESWIGEMFLPFFINHNYEVIANGKKIKIDKIWEPKHIKIDLGEENEQEFIVYIKKKEHSTKEGIKVRYFSENFVLDKTKYTFDWSVSETEILVGSDYFDEHIDSTGTRIEIDKDTDELIKEGIEKLCREYFAEELNKLHEENTELRSNFEKTYPFLSDLMADEDAQGTKRTDEKKLYEKCTAELAKHQKKILGLEDIDDKYIPKIENIASRNLMQYIMLRELLITKLENAHDEKESFFHNYIMKMNSSWNKNNSDYIHLNSPNFWIFDERFMSCQKAFSNKRIGNIFSSLDEPDMVESILDNGRPDIFILLSEEYEEDKSADVVIIELKKRQAEKGHVSSLQSEMGERIRAIHDHGNPSVRRVFTFSILEINDKVKTALETSGYRELHGHSEYFYKYDIVGIRGNSSLNVVYNILSWNAVINDARLRNKTFMEVLKNTIKTFSFDEIPPELS